MSHHWLMHHNLFSNWSFEVSKTSKNSFFYKPSGHKKHNFWTVHTQSSQFNCSIMDWCNTIYSLIEVLKSTKRPKAFFFTSPVDTNNASFERSRVTLRNDFLTKWWEISSFCQINDFGEMFFWRSWWRHKLMRKKSHWLIR